MSQEQIDDVQKYLKIKDFYELLGVAKDATDEQIKKAYKKLALRFHPDKNKAEGSKEVFKKIAQACDCLMNPEKRAAYDRYGNEEPEQHFSHYRQQYHDDISPDNIFEMFFGKNNPFFQFEQQGGFQQGSSQVFYTSFGPGGMQGNGPQSIFDLFSGAGGVHQRHMRQPNNGNNGQQQQQQHPQQQRRSSNKLMSILQLLPLFLIFFGGFIGNLFQQGPLYQLEASRTHNMHRHTKLLHLDYYVSSDFMDKVKKEPSWMKEVEFSIEQDHVTQLRNECSHTKQIQRQIQIQLQAARSEADKKYYNNKIASLKKKSCEELDRFQEVLNVDIDAVFS